MWCPTVVGWGTLIGYNSKQCYWSIRGETKDSTQAKYPHLKGQMRRGWEKMKQSNVLCAVLNHVSVIQLCSMVGVRVWYLWAVRSDCDSEQVHGHKHSCHHPDQDKVAGISINSHALLYKTKKHINILVLLAPWKIYSSYEFKKRMWTGQIYV